MKVGDLVKVRVNGTGPFDRIGIIASFKTIHYGGRSYPHVLVNGKIEVCARNNLEVLNESR